MKAKIVEKAKEPEQLTEKPESLKDLMSKTLEEKKRAFGMNQNEIMTFSNYLNQEGLRAQFLQEELKVCQNEIKVRQEKSKTLLDEIRTLQLKVDEK